MIPFSARPRERITLEFQAFKENTYSCQQLEDAISDYHGYAYAIAFASPTAAFTAALTVAGIQSGDEVFTAAMAPQSRFTALQHVNATARYADITLDGTLDERGLAHMITPSTKALISGPFTGIGAPVQTRPASLTCLDDLCGTLHPADTRRLALWTLEPLMPEGVEKTGFVLTQSAEEATQLRRAGMQGHKPGSLWNYDILPGGADALLSPLAAAIALKQVPLLPAYTERCRENAAQLDTLLGKSHLFTAFARTDRDTPGSYPLLLVPELYCPKEDIFSAIQAHGVEVKVCCKPVYKTTAFKAEGLRLGVTEDFYKALLQLPSHHQLRSEEIVEVARAFTAAIETQAHRGCRF